MRTEWQANQELNRQWKTWHDRPNQRVKTRAQERIGPTTKNPGAKKTGEQTKTIPLALPLFFPPGYSPMAYK